MAPHYKNFGHDVTAKFLDQHGLSMVITATDKVQNGYTVSHNKQWWSLCSIAFKT